MSFSLLFLALYSLICWTQYSLLHGARISWVGERDYDAPNWVHKCLSCPPANEPSSFFCIKLNPGTSWSPNSTYLHLDFDLSTCKESATLEQGIPPNKPLQENMTSPHHHPVFFEFIQTDCLFVVVVWFQQFYGVSTRARDFSISYFWQSFHNEYFCPTSHKAFLW